MWWCSSRQAGCPELFFVRAGLCLEGAECFQEASTMGNFVYVPLFFFLTVWVHTTVSMIVACTPFPVTADHFERKQIKICRHTVFFSTVTTVIGHRDHMVQGQWPCNPLYDLLCPCMSRLNVWSLDQYSNKQESEVPTELGAHSYSAYFHSLRSGCSRYKCNNITHNSHWGSTFHTLSTSTSTRD